ncbi:MAG TPA: M48 family metallopeptidase [Steroidobacteraceae bacterium]|nr:M48 family metallopeptidase [Steroidobacteraceae bacterium]
MNFFARQANARATARRLIWLFVLAVVAVVLAVDAITLFVFSMFAAHREELTGSFADFMSAPSLWVWTSLVVLCVIGTGSVYRSSQLSAGGGAVAQQLGAERVPHDTRDPLRRRLWNVVEEMSIASGVPIPAIYVLEDEHGINAFAAGHTTSDAAITVTRGALERLNRSELQGVIGHEFSHVLNGDMRVNIRLMGLLFGLLVIGYIGQFVMRGASGNRKGGALVLAGLGVMILGYTGLFFGRLIQAAVSRQCEKVADASAVQFTRDPQGLRDALVKIGALEEGSRMHAAGTEEVAHMLFAPGLSRAFATHPPLIERIRTLDPSFDESEFARVGAKMLATQALPDADATESEMPGAAAFAGSAGKQPIAADAQSITRLVGNPATSHLALARGIREALPAELLERVNDPARAVGVLWSLLLDEDAGVRQKQLAVLEERLGARHAEVAASHYLRIAALDPLQRLPLLMRLFPALRRLPQVLAPKILDAVSRVAQADGNISVHEYALARIARQELGGTSANQRRGTLKLSDVTTDLQTVFSLLALQGGADGTAARRAYEFGLSGLLPRERPGFSPIPDWVASLDDALGRLDQLVPAAKEALIEALVKTISHDNELTIGEAELLRAICATIHCPLPPLVA